MPHEIKMPALSPTMTEGNIATWLKKEGDKIRSGEIIAEIETDKATMELESSYEGILGKILIHGGAEGVKVNTPIAILLQEGEKPEMLESYIPSQLANSDVSGSASDVSNSSVISQENLVSSTPKVSTAPVKDIEIKTVDTEEKIYASPLAKRIANNKGIDIKGILGTGPGGRIIKTDVENYSPSFLHSKQKLPQRNAVAYNSKPASSIRKIIAKRLLSSKQNVPHFYLSASVDISDLINCRQKINALLAAKNIKVSVNDFIIKASSLALYDFPNVNASWNEDSIAAYNNIDISIAVSTKDGLVTPIIKNADAKSISEISSEMKVLSGKARENKLKPEEFQGGGFSISNLGMYGIESFNAIINPPQSAILAVGASIKKLIYCEKTDDFVKADIMNITLSADHRVIDGVLGAEFLNRIRFYLENPFMLFQFAF